ncbi:hypothetical protein [Streptomyces sp. NPDC048357]|uniref:hypothetical protein n=1 Tax=Streptomyces sp. NPDC048357 TaxID=3154719 RepID=UPI00341F7944
MSFSAPLVVFLGEKTAMSPGEWFRDRSSVSSRKWSNSARDQAMSMLMPGSVHQPTDTETAYRAGGTSQN